MARPISQAPGAPVATVRATQATAAEFLAEGRKRGWKAGGRAGALFAAKFILAPILVWAVIVKLGVLPYSASGNFSMLLSVALVVLALPVGAIVRVDNLAQVTAAGSSVEMGLLVAAVVVVLNFAVLGAIRGVLPAKKNSPE